MATEFYKIVTELKKEDVYYRGDRFIKAESIVVNLNGDRRIVKFCASDGQYEGIEKGYIFYIRDDNYIYNAFNLHGIYVDFGERELREKHEWD